MATNDNHQKENHMTKNCFETKLIEINTWCIALFPKEASLLLPTRGMTLVSGTLNNNPFESALEPDGNGSHWLRVDGLLPKAAVGDSVSICVKPIETWFEPEVPEDLKRAIESADLLDVWQSLTTKARWEWVRWVRFTKNPDTRQNRIEVTCSKLNAGKKRPCCFDLSRCTETTVSKSGVLDVPFDVK